MSTESIGLLACLALVAFLLLDEIRRTRRALEESIRAHQHAINKVPELESQVRKLSKIVERLEK